MSVPGAVLDDRDPVVATNALVPEATWLAAVEATAAAVGNGRGRLVFGGKDPLVLAKPERTARKGLLKSRRAGKLGRAFMPAPLDRLAG